MDCASDDPVFLEYDTMMIKFKVLDSIGGLMFNAEVSDIYITMLSKELTPFISNVIKVPEGTGNEGKNLEYQCTYEGHSMKYESFRKMMDEMNC